MKNQITLVFETCFADDLVIASKLRDRASLINDIEKALSEHNGERVLVTSLEKILEVEELFE